MDVQSQQQTPGFVSPVSMGRSLTIEREDAVRHDRVSRFFSLFTFIDNHIRIGV